MVGVIFFLTSSPILDLAFFTSDFANCTTGYMPNIITAPDGWGYFFFHLFSHSGQHFLQVILPIVLQISPKITPTIRCCSQHLMVGVNFFLTSSPILDLGHFSQVILPIVLQIMPPPKNNPNHKVQQHLMVGVNFFFDLFSHSDLGHFSQVILPIVLAICPTIRGSQHLMVGVIFFFDFAYFCPNSGLRFFLPVLIFRGFFTNNFAPAQK